MSKAFKILLACCTLLILAFLLYRHYVPESPAFFEIEHPEMRDISDTIYGAGTIQAKNQIKVGSLVTGVIRKLHIKENDSVEKGQLLAEIETGIADTDVRQAEGLLQSKEADTFFLDAEYQRLKKLYGQKYVSDSDVQNAQRAFKVATKDQIALRATLDKAQMAYDNTNIRSPGSGIVTTVSIATGERVTTDLNATIICEIAPDVSKMEAILNVDERDIGRLKKGLTVHLTVDAYPDRKMSTAISNISFSPKKLEQGGPPTYQAYADVYNPELLLHPGMSISASIDVSAIKGKLTVSSRVFLIKPEQIKLVAKVLGFEVFPLSPEKKADFIQKHPNTNVQTVWQLEDRRFIEQPLVLGITNGIYYEVKEGLTGKEGLVVNLADETELKTMLQKS